MPEKIIILSHIAKTAGTSLNYIFRRHFGARLMACLFREGAPQQSYSKQNFEKDLAVFGRCLCISGHCLRPWVDFSEYEERFQRILFVRQADKRFLSLYAHEQSYNNNEYHMDLLDWAAKFNRSDGMVQYIAGEKNLQKAIDIIEEKNIYVGMQDQYSESLQQIKKIIGLAHFNTETNMRRMESKNDAITDNIKNHYSKYKDCILENNTLDCQLYQYAKTQIWPRQVSEAEKISNPDCLEQNMKDIDKHWQFMLKDRMVYKPHLYLESLFRSNRS